MVGLGKATIPTGWRQGLFSGTMRVVSTMAAVRSLVR